MVQQVRDPALPLQWLGSLLWHVFSPCLAWEPPNAVGVAKKKKKKKPPILTILDPKKWVF